MTTNTKKRLGRVCIDFGYIVDLDNAEMVEDAKQCLLEDMMDAFKYGEIVQYIEVEKDPYAHEDEIPDFLRKPNDTVTDDE